jgi:hypothetical protein
MTTDTLEHGGACRAADDPRMISLTKKLCFIAPLGVVQVGVYWLLNHYLFFTSRELPLTAIDRATPFLLWTIWGYIALIAMAPGLPLLVRDNRVFWRLLRAYVMAMGTAWLFYLFFPTHYPRPPLPSDDSWHSMAYRAIMEFDSPECCFPSTHVIVPLLVAAALRRDKTFRRWWPLVAACVVLCCFSILTTKQHYLWDLLGGAGLAGLAWRIAGKDCRRV